MAFYLVKYIGPNYGDLAPEIKDGFGFESPIKRVVNGQWVPFSHRPRGDLGKFFEVQEVTDEEIRESDGAFNVYINGEEEGPLSEAEINGILEHEQEDATNIRLMAQEIRAKYDRVSLHYIIKALKNTDVYPNRKAVERRCRELDASFRAVDETPPTETELREQARRQAAGLNAERAEYEDDSVERMEPVRSTIRE